MISKEQLQAIMPKITGENLEKYTHPLNQAMDKFDINTPLRIAAFLAQLAHESNELKYSEENLNYSAERLMAIFPKHFKTLDDANKYARQPEKIANKVYANKGGNGDEASGDGWKYRGRCPIQCTLKDNYRLAGKAIGVDLVTNPDLAAGPVYGTMIAAEYWHRNKINIPADAGDIAAVTKKINIALLGLEDRTRYYKLAKSVLGV